MPAIPSCIIDPIWDQFAELLPEKKVEHPLGCHNPRIPDRVVFDKLVQVLVFGCAAAGLTTDGKADLAADRSLLAEPRFNPTGGEGCGRLSVGA